MTYICEQAGRAEAMRQVDPDFYAGEIEMLKAQMRTLMERK